MSSVGEKIKQRRMELGLTGDDLAAMVGCSRMQIWRYETNNNEPTAKVIALLAQILKVSSDWLLDLDTIEKPLTADEHERELLNLYHTKSPEAQKKIIEFAKAV